MRVIRIVLKIGAILFFIFSILVKALVWLTGDNSAGNAIQGVPSGINGTLQAVNQDLINPAWSWVFNSLVSVGKGLWSLVTRTDSGSSVQDFSKPGAFVLEMFRYPLSFGVLLAVVLLVFLLLDGPEKTWGKIKAMASFRTILTTFGVIGLGNTLATKFDLVTQEATPLLLIVFFAILLIFLFDPIMGWLKKVFEVVAPLFFVLCLALFLLGVLDGLLNTTFTESANGILSQVKALQVLSLLGEAGATAVKNQTLGTSTMVLLLSVAALFVYPIIKKFSPNHGNEIQA